MPIEYDNKNCKEFLKYYCNISARLITRLVRTEMGITRDNQLLRTIDNVYVGDKVVLTEDKKIILKNRQLEKNIVNN